MQNQNAVAFQEELVALEKSDAERAADLAEHRAKEELKRDERLRELQSEIDCLNEIKRQLPQKRQLFWSIEFAEIFQEKGGFDVVIGNPPYVIYKRIIDPFDLERGVEPSAEGIAKYKGKLEKAVKDDWGELKINRRSDLYVYFYLKGLSLLNDKGVFCYISSNAWLDVEYGARLQEFLLTRMQIHSIYDNEVKRSFKRADVNTIIAVLGLSTGGVKEGAESVARFVMFKQPFEAVVTSEVLLDTENAAERKLIERSHKGKSLPYARVFPMTQGDLYRAGLESEDEKESLKITTKDPFAGVYGGNKWGGKSLRAPDIYWVLLDRGQLKLIELRRLCDIITGIKESGYREYIRPIAKATAPISQRLEIVKNPRDHASVQISRPDSYIDTGKALVIARKVVSKRAPILWLAMRGDRHIVHVNRDELPFTGNFFGLRPYATSLDVVAALLNSTMTVLLAEIYGRKGFGQGATILVKSDLGRLEIVNPRELGPQTERRLADALDAIARRKVHSVFQELGLPKPNKDFSNIRLEDVSLDKVLPDRRALDDIIFDILGLTKEEREEVYRAVIELVTNRLKKARSV